MQLSLGDSSQGSVVVASPAEEGGYDECGADLSRNIANHKQANIRRLASVARGGPTETTKPATQHLALVEPAPKTATPRSLTQAIRASTKKAQASNPKAGASDGAPRECSDLGALVKIVAPPPSPRDEATEGHSEPSRSDSGEANDDEQRATSQGLLANAPRAGDSESGEVEDEAMALAERAAASAEEQLARLG